MRIVHHFILLAAIVASTSSAVAQERGGRRPGEANGGFGGPMLLGQKSVQEELKLTDEQVKQVNDLTAKLREANAGGRDLSREERVKRFTESRATSRKAIESILNEEQRQRLEQISLQLAGPAALSSPGIAEKLNLTDEQQKAIKEIQSSNQDEVRSLLRDAEGNRGEAFRKIQAARQTTQEKLQGLLTEAQKNKWQELIGAKFEGRLERPGGREFGRGRRARQGAELRRDTAATVLTAEKSDDASAEKREGKQTKQGDKKAKSNRKHGKRHGHAARHRDDHRGPQARHGHHRQGHKHHVARGGFHRHPHARSVYGRHFAARGPQARHHFHGDFFHREFDARSLAWHRVARVMGAHHGHRQFSHFGPRAYHRHDWRHLAQRAPGAHGRHRDRAHFAERNWHGAGLHFRVSPRHAWQGHRFAAHHRRGSEGFNGWFAGGSHGPGIGHPAAHRGPNDRPLFAWHFDRQREDGPRFDRERGPRDHGHHASRFHSAGFKKRHHDAGDHPRGKKDGEHAQRCAKRQHQDEQAREKSKDRDSKHRQEPRERSSESGVDQDQD